MTGFTGQLHWFVAYYHRKKKQKTGNTSSLVLYS